MTAFNLTEISEQLKQASEAPCETGVSFNGKSLKLNNENDATVVVQAIEQCSRLDYLNLEGNTLGPDAAKAVAKALEIHGGPLKRALWKDMFTGRMKDEIPKALEYLGGGLCIAGARLVELDLSDNAFGPIGVKGLASLLSSSACFTLRELRLNNNGLGITGGKMLAKALLDCHANSSKENGSDSRPLALRVFIAGRNRLENEGAEALAQVFEQLTSLEEVAMPQNGIYHKGVAALAKALSVNPNLKILNLNDNTVRLAGARALAKALPNLPQLERLNLGDCLLKTSGSLVLAEALGRKGSHPNLVELNLSYNEIGSGSIDALVAAVADKQNLTSLQLDGNTFGGKGKTSLRQALTECNRIEALGSLDEVDSEEDSNDESNSDNEDENEEDDDEESSDAENAKVDETEDGTGDGDASWKGKDKQEVNVTDFIKNPTAENLLRLRGDKIQSFIEHAKIIPMGTDQTQDDMYVEKLMRITMKVSSLCTSGYMDARIEAEQLSENLYHELFTYARKNEEIARLNNALLVNLGLIKSEDKSNGRIDWNLEGCFKALEKISQKEYFDIQTRDTLKIFIELPTKSGRPKTDPFQEAKTSLKAILDQL